MPSACRDGDLKVLHCGNANCTSGNSVVTVDSDGSVGWDASMVLDGSGFPVVSYYDSTNGDLKVVHCGNANCSSVNVISIPDTSGTVGRHTSIVLDGSGFPVISYKDDTNSALKVLHCGDANCSSGNSVVSAVTSNVDGHTSIALDSNGFPVVSYKELSAGNLSILHCGNANCTSGNTVTVPDTSARFEHTSLVLDASGFPVVSYWDKDGNDLKVLHCANANCS